MTSPFSRPALVCNTQSGSHDEAVREQIVELCRDHGVPLVATFALPDDDIPDVAELTRQGIDLLLVWTGDGTINAAAIKAAGWDGAILVLPGGTLNLLSKALHGDRPVTEILADALQVPVAQAARVERGAQVVRVALVAPARPPPTTRWTPTKMVWCR